MIGIDTNVLLRLFTADNPEQTEAALKLMRGCGPGSIRITNIVVAELVWTLLGRKYKLEKHRLVEVVEELLRRVELVFESRGAVMMALRWYEGGKADFSDYLIAALNEEASASPTFTFDRMAAGHIAFAPMTP
jgi:predicted nucleic-acid-binding protein